jgi:hypothetical protein
MFAADLSGAGDMASERGADSSWQCTFDDGIPDLHKHELVT